MCLFIVSLIIFTGLTHAEDEAFIRNFIFIIGDGTSFAQLDSSRIAHETTFIMDTMPVQGAVDTHSLNNNVTDSAAGATALAGGQLTNNGMIAMLPSGEHVSTILEMAQKIGKATGVVVTDNLYGATPGSFIAHARQRSESENILNQAIFETSPDVLLGGGYRVFRNIDGEKRLAETDYTLVRTRDELLDQPNRSPKKLLGIFADETMAYEWDRGLGQPHIAEMVDVALTLLDRSDDGFFLMIEGARIDHANHANDLLRSVHEVAAFDEAIGVALDFAKKDGNTIVIVTADHETGGLTPPDKTPSPQAMLYGVDKVTDHIVNAYRLDPTRPIADVFAKCAGIHDFDDRVIQGSFPHAVKSLLEERVYYYTTTGHTATKVPILAYGPHAQRFLEVNHTVEVGQMAINLFGVDVGVTDPLAGFTMIRHVDELQAIQYDPNGNYALANNIDASETAQWHESKGFVPINDFKGVFDGQGYVISGLNINRPEDERVGLFGTLHGGTVRHVGIENASVIGKQYVGALVGYMSGGLLMDTYSTGRVESTYRGVGGLVGDNRGSGIIRNSYSEAMVVGVDRWVGGLVGIHRTGLIEKSYATGDVMSTGEGYVGGFVGASLAVIRDSYATGNVVNNGRNVGGFVGSNDAPYSTPGQVIRSYSTGKVIHLGDGKDVGGLVGKNNDGDGAKVEHSFWNTETSEMLKSAAGTGVTTAEMRDREFWENEDWDLGFVEHGHSVWYLLPGQEAPLLTPFSETN